MVSEDSRVGNVLKLGQAVIGWQQSLNGACQHNLECAGKALGNGLVTSRYTSYLDSEQRLRLARAPLSSCAALPPYMPWTVGVPSQYRHRLTSCAMAAGTVRGQWNASPSCSAHTELQGPVLPLQQSYLATLLLSKCSR